MHCAIAHTGDAEIAGTVASLVSSKFTWHEDGAKDVIIEGTLAEITAHSLDKAFSGKTVSYKSDASQVELRADPAPRSYLTSDNKQCRNVTVTILVAGKVVNSFGREACVKLSDLLPPVKKEQ